MNLKVYLAGPMRGYDQFNFPAFDAAAERLRASGWEVLSPADRDRAEGFDETRNTLADFDLAAAMRDDLAWVIEADGIVLLQGWEESTGARIERLVAETCGKRVFPYDDRFEPPVRPDYVTVMKAEIA